MKKNIRILFVLGIILNYSLIKINAESFTYDQLLHDTRYPYFALTLKKICGHPIKNIDIINNNKIQIDFLSFHLTVPYKKVMYSDLTNFEKKLFNHYKFDQNQWVTVIGMIQRFDTINYYKFMNDDPLPLNGSISVSGKVKYITWIFESGSIGRFDRLDNKFIYKLLDEENSSSKIASATINDHTKTIDYVYLNQ